jgi:hypothetical protein
MIQRFILTAAVLFFFLSSVNGQIQFTNSPSRLQLLPRNADDSATVDLSGVVTAPQYTSIIFTFSRSGTVRDSSVVPLTFSNSQAPFTKTYRIKAEKALHNFRVYLRQGTSNLQVLRADSVVAGDVYIINGQSNATANATVSGTDAPYLWVRSFGNPTLTPSIAQADTTWGIAQGNTGSTAYSIGVWGIRLAKMLVDTFNIPICVINGSRPGTTIAEHQPSSSDPANLNTLYGRLYYRAIKAKVATAVKAIFWYQGENDGAALDAPMYASRFASLRSAWFTHYPAVQRIFVVQTRMGCIDGSPEQRVVRETQRTLKSTYPEVQVMSSMGISSFDGCHFLVSGYQTLAGYLYKQVSREMFNASQPVTADPPDIVNAVFTNSDNTELSLIFNQPVVWPAIFNGNNLKDYFYLNTPVTVVSGSVSGDTVKLQLSAPTNAYKISYLPNQYYNNTTTTYDGPWLTSPATVGALSFYSFPVSSGLSVSASSPGICASGNSVLTANKTGETFQWYMNGSLINGAVTNQYTATAAGAYYVTMTDANNITVTSNTVTIQQGSASTPPAISSNTGAFEFCSGGGIVLSSSITASSYLWSTGQTSPSINVFSPGTYTLTISDASGCTASSSPVNVIQNTPQPPVILSDRSVFCSGDSVLVTPSFGTVLEWSNGASAQSIYISNSVALTVSVQNSTGCVATSAAFSFTKDIPSTPVITGAAAFCAGDSVILTSSTAAAYNWSTSSTAAAIKVSSAGAYAVTITDSIGCTAASAPFNVNQFKAGNITISGTATHVCAGQTIQLTASGGSGYQWSTGATTTVITVNATGDYTVTARDANGCSGTSAAYHTDINAPQVSTSPAGQYYLCSGKKVTLTATAPTATSYQWYKGTSVLANGATASFLAGSSGSYKIKVTDASGCTAFSPVITVTAATTPAASFTVSNQFDACMDSMVTLTGLSGTLFTYQWQKSSVDIPGAASQVFNTVNKGSYRVIIASQYGCTKASAALSIPVASVTASVVASGAKSFCTGDSVKLTANSGTSYTYQWQRNGGNIAGATAQSYTVKTSGTYRVRVYNVMGCSATSSNTVVTVSNCGSRLSTDVITGKGEEVQNFNIYPNPFSNAINVDAALVPDEPWIYRLFDISGRLMQSGESSASSTIIMPDAALPDGLYILTMEGSFGIRTFKVQKTAEE